LGDQRRSAVPIVCIVEGATRPGEVARTFYRGDESVDVMVGTRFAMNSVALGRELAIRGVGLAVLPDWRVMPVQVHGVTETRLLPARTRLFIEFLKARLREP
jgi:DNA-binding transcriptional LysR family regulator